MITLSRGRLYFHVDSPFINSKLEHAPVGIVVRTKLRYGGFRLSISGILLRIELGRLPDFDNPVRLFGPITDP